MPQSSNEHNEPTQVYFQGKGMPQQKFPVKFLFAVDIKFQIWLNECKSAAHCNEVNDSIINFHPLFNEVNVGSFHMDLPPTFSMKSLHDTTVAGPGGGGKRREPDDDERNRKKNGKGNGKACLLVRTISPIAKSACSQSNYGP